MIIFFFFINKHCTLILKNMKTTTNSIKLTETVHVYLFWIEKTVNFFLLKVNPESEA